MKSFKVLDKISGNEIVGLYAEDRHMAEVEYDVLAITGNRFVGLAGVEVVEVDEYDKAGIEDGDWRNGGDDESYW